MELIILFDDNNDFDMHQIFKEKLGRSSQLPMSIRILDTEKAKL